VPAWRCCPHFSVCAQVIVHTHSLTNSIPFSSFFAVHALVLRQFFPQLIVCYSVQLVYTYDRS